jgi:osmotically-inducible protein OsmY
MKTNSQLQQDVLAALKWEPSIEDGQIGVVAKDGIVTLSGHVESFGEKWDAERATQRVSGVKGLAVEMDVTIPGFSKRTDSEIASSVERAMQWTNYVPADSVKVMVEKGYVTLSGDVEWEYQREAAAVAVRYLTGVTGVNNQIALKPRASSTVVKADIEAALKRGAANDAKHVLVSVKGGDVTLSGTLPSWAERDLARNSAWGAPGVRNVIDNMEVAY